MDVALVITKHAGHLSDERFDDYLAAAEVLRRELDGLCLVSHYLDQLPRVGAIVLSGSSAPWAAHDASALDALGRRVVAANVPTLGICAGMQLLARFAGGGFGRMAAGGAERGFHEVEVVADSALLGAAGSWVRVFQEHTDEITSLPDEFEVVASSPACRVQAIISKTRPWWGTQFHPERYDAEHPDGRRTLQAFFAMAARE